MSSGRIKSTASRMRPAVRLLPTYDLKAVFSYPLHMTTRYPYRGVRREEAGCEVPHPIRLRSLASRLLAPRLVSSLLFDSDRGARGYSHPFYFVRAPALVGPHYCRETSDAREKLCLTSTELTRQYSQYGIKLPYVFLEKVIRDKRACRRSEIRWSPTPMDTRDLKEVACNLSAVQLMTETDKRVTYQQIRTNSGISMSEVYKILPEYLARYDTLMTPSPTYIFNWCHEIMHRFAGGDSDAVYGMTIGARHTRTDDGDNVQQIAVFNRPEIEKIAAAHESEVE
ncbi:hypothetical protein EVAR_57932_1 [Eumeta japonica]|uniref:Uncharacterized protein n=1 Tax=Eumeta variegata TaxID=151549 RepID=A0A4C1ZP21_EUMVA|nr:hypothetical protein EVAR_57932_1 [Eumeta japonica]